MRIDFMNARDVRPTDPKREIMCLFDKDGQRYWMANEYSALERFWDEVAFWCFAPAYEDVEDEAW